MIAGTPTSPAKMQRMPLSTNGNSSSRGLRRRLVFLSLVVLATLASCLSCHGGYILRSAWFQAELLLSREAIETLPQADFTPEEWERLEWIADVKAYGDEIGLSATDNYESLALDWHREIWNLSACSPLSLDPLTWRFPIVGSVPYLGYFRREDMEATRTRLVDEGLDVYARTAGAYSTLGWFRDPILPGMLTWTEAEIANTVLHEMTHATLWVKGSVALNESFASFVGDVASLRYLVNRHGLHSQPVLETVNRREDIELWRELQKALYGDLVALFGSPTLGEEAMLHGKSLLYADFVQKVATAPFHDPEPFVKAAQEGTWNNARMVQFRTYNFEKQWFATLLDTESGDLPAFILRVGAIVEDAEDPFQALAAAVGVQDY